MTKHLLVGLLASALCAAFFIQCGDDGNDAVDRMIGAECAVPADCDDDDDDTLPLDCLTEFAGGYCGDASCIDSGDCPDGSSCVDYLSTTYCFLNCTDKADCNPHRSTTNEANCSSSVKTVEDNNQKVCVPPSSGI